MNFIHAPMQENFLPLHPAQRDVYFDQMVNKNSSHYNLGGYIKLKGSLNIVKFTKTVALAPAVFDVFKMRFNTTATEPVFHIDNNITTLHLSEIDFSNKHNPEESALEFMREQFNTPYNLNTEHLLFDHFLIKISSSEHWLFGKYHHLIMDGYGFVLWAKFLGLKYKSLIDDTHLQFNYPAYEKQAIKDVAYYLSDNYKTDGAYWQQKWVEIPKKIIQKKQPNNNLATNSKTFTYILAPNKIDLLRELQVATGAGLQQLTIAALLIHYGKTLNNDSFSFGIPIHKRGSKQLRNTLGMFSGILPFKGVFKKDMLLIDLLKNINIQQKNDYRHHQYLIGDLSRHLKLNAAQGYLFDIVINHELLNFDLDFGSKLSTDIIRINNESETLPLQICWQDYGANHSLKLQLHFRNDYFNQPEIELLTNRILYILDQFPQSLDKEISSINILPKQEKIKIENFNPLPVEYAKDESIIDMIQQQATLSPDQIAVLFEHSTVTYLELNERANQLAHYLKSKGVAAGVLVPVCIERSIQMMVAIFAILKAGGTYVPIDPEYPAERINYMLADTKAAIVLTSVHACNKLTVNVDVEVIAIDDALLNVLTLPKNNLQVNIKDDQLAYIIYTSGSTGKPKGVMITHQNVYSFLCWCKNEFAKSVFDMVYAGTSICFDLSVFEMFFPLIIGKPIRLLKNSLEITKYLLLDKNVLINCVPAVVQSLLQQETDLNNISVINMAGEPIPQSVMDGLNADKMEVRNLYGPTEDTTYSTCYRIKNNSPILIGKPIDNTQVYIVDNDLNIVPIGVTGQICISGAGITKGYLNLPQVSSEKFVANPFSVDGSKMMYKTGDVGRCLTDGNIDYQGRIDEQVKVRGYRIELGEIEQVLQVSPAVKQAVVLARRGNNEQFELVAYVVSNGEYNRREMQAYLQNKLPDYMVPSLWVNIVSIPLMPNGKIDKITLANYEVSNTIANEYAPPVTPMEIQLTAIWEATLKADRIGVHDNFFELGGNSLHAIQLTSRLHKILNLKIDIGVIFLNPTIKQLCEALKLATSNQFEAIQKIPEQVYYSLSHAQKRFWILSHFNDGSSAYNVSNAFTIAGNLDVTAFKQAFDTVIKRHEILRTVFIEIDGEAKQKILTLKEYNFDIQEINLLSNEDANNTLKTFLEDDSKKTFDLLTGPLMRASLFHINVDKHVLVINIHHIISDGWSKGIFINEVLHLYKIYSADYQNDLPPLNIQYKDYAVWHASVGEMQGNYWRNIFEKEIPLLNFPTDFERPKVLTFFGAMLHHRIPATLASQLQKMAVENNMSLNNLIFALYGIMLARYSGQEEVVIGSLSSGRSHIDLEKLIGVFINFLPIKLLPSRQLKLSDYLKTSNQQLVQGYNNQDYPFDRMVDDCIKKRDAARNPFFDTMVNFHLQNELHSQGKLQAEQLTGTDIAIAPFKDIQEDLFQSVLDFKLDIEANGNTYDFYLSYNSKLFLKESMQSFLNAFTELLTMAVNEPDKQLKDYGVWENEKNINAKNNIVEQIPPSSTLSLNICSSFVMEPVQDYITYWSNEFELDIEINFAPYNQVFQQLINPQSLLNSGTGINVLCIKIDDWLRDKVNDNPIDQLLFLNNTYNELVAAITTINVQVVVPFLVLITPFYSGLNFTDEVASLIKKMNENLTNFIAKLPRFNLLNVDTIAELYDVKEVYDAKTDELGHMPFTQEFYAALGTFIARKANAFKSQPYKVIVLDCDNTLWKGVCGELGALEVAIDENFTCLQQFMLQKYDEGFLLALCSKNNEADVWEVFDNNPNMKITREHIAAYRINWQPKSDNILSISNELKLGLNSFIFIDDSEFETEQITVECPDVLTIQLPEDEVDFKNFLNHIWAFDYFQITSEDANRNEMYNVEKSRNSEKENHSSLEKFIQSLEIKVNIYPLTNIQLDRAVQLTLRTNQFNLNGIRKTAEELSLIMKDATNHLNWIVEVKDRFGDYGIVGLLLAKKQENTLNVISFLLSCRVLGRNVEDNILAELQKYCVIEGIKIIDAQFETTAKNKPFQDFLSRTDWIYDSITNTYKRFINSTQTITALQYEE